MDTPLTAEDKLSELKNQYMFACNLIEGLNRELNRLQQLLFMSETKHTVEINEDE